MYEIFGLTEEQGKAIDRALCNALAPLLGCEPDDISDEAVLKRLGGADVHGSGTRGTPGGGTGFEVSDGDFDSLVSRLS